MKPLKDIKIIDFSRLLPGPLGTHLLSELGAEVLKINRKENEDPVKNQPPFINGISTLYFALNHKKDELSFDFENPEETLELHELIKKSDVLIEQFRPGAMKRWNLDYENLKKINPKLIYISLTGFGQNGQMGQEAGHDINFLALSGFLDMNRDENGKPIIPGVQIADIAGGAFQLQSACLSAVLERNRTDKGLFIDLSMTAGLLPLMIFPLSQNWGSFDPHQLKILNGGLVNYNVYQCADKKWIAMGALELKFWNSFCMAVEKSEWTRSDIVELSVYNFDKIAIENLFKTKSRNEWAEWAKGKNVCITAILEINEIEENSHVDFQIEKIQTVGSFFKSIKNSY